MTMLQISELQRRFGAVETAVAHAAQACSAERDLSGELRGCIQRLDKLADTIKPVLAARDTARTGKLADELEVLGARARQICRSGAAVSPPMKSAVNRLYDELMALQEHLRREAA